MKGGMETTGESIAEEDEKGGDETIGEWRTTGYLHYRGTQIGKIHEYPRMKKFLCSLDEHHK